MPTGFTAAVESGEITTLKQFALQCARGMGACITMRDAPFDAPIPDQFEPEVEFYQTRLTAAHELLKVLENLTPEQCDSRAANDFRELTANFEQREAERKERNARYESMLQKVRGWTTEAEGIRDFMLQQLTISIDTYAGEPPVELTGAQWLVKTRKEALRDISYYETHIADEIHRVALRNRWLADLRRSLADVRG
jgi:hypothetical protein